MIYELRVYWANPGKLEALHNRFRQVTLALFERHHMQVNAFWMHLPTTEDSGDLVYILAFPDVDAVRTAWDAFVNDPNWIKGGDASEVNGELVKKATSSLLAPTDYSPLK